MKNGYIKFKIHRGIHDKVTRFGLELYDWGLFIFITMVSILLFKRIIIIAILLDIPTLIFLRKYKKGKPDLLYQFHCYHFYSLKKSCLF